MIANKIKGTEGKKGAPVILSKVQSPERRARPLKPFEIQVE